MEGPQDIADQRSDLARARSVVLVVLGVVVHGEEDELRGCGRHRWCAGAHGLRRMSRGFQTLIEMGNDCL